MTVSSVRASGGITSGFPMFSSRINIISLPWLWMSSFFFFFLGTNKKVDEMRR